MANYLVTGGAGFIGSNIVEYLAGQAESVRVLDNFSTGRRENLAGVSNRIELIEGDLRDPDACARAAEDMDFVLHQGALPSVPRSIDEPVESAAINVLGTVQLLNACAKAKVKRFIYAASSSAYGDLDVTVKNESLFPAPISPYAAGKLGGEFFCKSFHAIYGLETICLRYFNVFGPRQDPNSPYSAVVPLFVAAMLAGRAPTIYGDGLQSRDFTYVENVVNANILATRAPKEAAGRVFNIACGKSYSLLNLAAEINAALGTSIAPLHAPARRGDVRHSLADIRAAREMLGYNPNIEFTDGIRKTIQSYRGMS
ncbi:SDR family oxidoreductase [Candidatus Sumerlaeota bacterium]|nr:SDR family oxidoreductase [Candidatus Sumerlaeota bacterium]